MLKIHVVILTYNRPRCLDFSLKCIALQTYPCAEVTVVDNGSSSNTDEIIQKYKQYMNIKLVRLCTNQNVHFLLTSIALASPCEIIAPFVSDDDFYCRRALAQVRRAFDSSDVVALGTAYRRYNLSDRKISFGPDDLYESPDLPELFYVPAGLGLFKSYCSQWGVGKENEYVRVPMAHPSGTFFRKTVIERTVRSQGSLFLGCFGDVGYLGVLLRTDYVHYLTDPVLIVSEGHPRTSDCAETGGPREIAGVSSADLIYTPFKAITFPNLAANSHLAVVHANNIYNPVEFMLTGRFFMLHYNAIMKDIPWTERTHNELREVETYVDTCLDPERTLMLSTLEAMRSDFIEKQTSDAKDYDGLSSKVFTYNDDLFIELEVRLSE
jgi:hypothetical protein